MKTVYSKNTTYSVNNLIYQNFHKHSIYTNPIIVDSCAYPEDYAKRAAELGHGIISSVEHGYQGRYIESFEMAEKYNLKYLFGVEAYFVYNRFEKDNTNAHICLLAKNENGRKAINRILSEAAETGFYYRSRVDYELIMSLPEDDVWISTACLAGLWRYDGKNDKSESLNIEYKNHLEFPEPYEWLIYEFSNKFKDNFYLEVQSHNVDRQKDLNKKIVEISNKYNIEIIAGVDSHFILPQDEWKRDYLQRSTSGIVYDDEDGFYMDYPSGQTLFKRFKTQGVLSDEDIMIALDNTNKFLEVEKYTSVIFNKDMKMPSAPKYEKMTKAEKQRELVGICYHRWEEIKKEIPVEQHQHYLNEIVKELDIIFKIDHEDYFLLNYELIKEATTNRGGMITFSGRGCVQSGALIPTDKTLKKIEDVQVGDKVLSSDGLFHNVLNTYKYDIEEPMIQIVHDYGTNTKNPIVLTKEHKVLIYRDGKKIWVEAQDVKISDYVCCPKIKNNNFSEEYIDLNNYNIYGFEYDDDYIYEYNANIGVPYKYSPTDISQKIGCGKSLIENLANGKIKDIGIRKKELKKRFFEYVPFNSFEEYQSYIKNIRTKKIKRYIKNDYNYNVLIGLLYGDGCHRYEKHTISLALNSVTDKDRINRKFFEDFCKDMGFEIYEHNHSDKKLTQLTFTSFLYSEYLNQEMFNSKLNQDKVFNSNLFNQNQENLKGLKYGLWLADGSDKDGRISFDNTSLSLINAYKVLSMMVEDCGVCSISIRDAHIDNRGYHNKSSYKLRYPKDPFTTGRGHYEILQDNDFWYLRVKEVKNVPLKKTSVYDFTVEGMHDYLANNMIVHNSGPSFYVNHLLGFTQIDRISSPITLYPERFLSTSRMSAGSLADIDFNCGVVSVFAQTQKDILGDGHSYPMIAYGTMKPKSAWKMYCRAVDVDFEISNAISGKIDEYETDLKYWDEESGEDEPNVYDYIPEDLREAFDGSKEFLGLTVQASAHPCGFLLLQQNIKEEVGIVRLKSKSGRETICACLDGKWCESYLMLKNDLLTVACVKLAYLLYERVGIPYMSLNGLLAEVKAHPEVWNMYEKGYVIGLNQVEKPSTQRKVMKYKPKNISELSAFIAGIRPAFKSLLDKLINREHFEYGIPTLDKLLQTEELPESFILYQEQIMKILSFAGIPMGDCYTVIKSISKKRFAKIMHYKEQFMTGMEHKLIEEEGISKERAEETAKTIWGIVEDASAYGFNSSHSLSVSFDSLLAAYFKALYPYEFYEVYLNLQMERADKAKALLAKKEMKEAFDISVLPMRFRQDNRKFVALPEQKALSNCLKSIKGFGDRIGEEFYKIKDTHYEDFIDFLVDIDIMKKNKEDSENYNPDIPSGFAVNGSQIETLIMLNYFEEFGKNYKLLKLFKLYNDFSSRKQINKKDINMETGVLKSGKDTYYLDITVFKKYIGKETKSMYKDLDMIGYVKEMASKVPDKSVDLLEQLKFERELLEFPIYQNPSLPKGWYYVIGFKTYGDKINTPYLVLYDLITSDLVVCSINKSKLFRDNPFGFYSIIHVKSFQDVVKKKKVGEKKFVPTNETKKVIVDYEVILRNEKEELEVLEQQMEEQKNKKEG